MEKYSTNDVINLLKNKHYFVKSKFDALFILLHGLMESAGFKLVGLGESENLVENKEIPNEWNASDDAWAFRYRHNKSSMTFLLKAIRMDNQLLVHALAVETKQNLNLDLIVDDYVNDVHNFDDIHEIYKNIDKLNELFTKNIMSKLLPSVEDIRSSPTTTTRNTPQPNTRVPPPHRDYDPLRIGPPRSPQNYGGGFHPFGMGGEDLFPGPGGGFGYFPGVGGSYGPYGGPPGHFGGGSFVGPHHPSFGIRDPSVPPMPRGPNRGEFPPLPGARYDPYGPPGMRPNPNPDHMPPPGYDYSDDMFM